MAFEGDLSQLGLGDVLQTIAMSRQVGTFILRGKEERRLGCSAKGVALLTSRKSLGLRIGAVLIGSGKIKQSDLDAAVKLQARRRDLMLGQALSESGACSVDDVRAARRYLAAEEIFELFLWTEGQFDFQSGEPDGSGPFADLWFDVSSLAMEAARRLDEIPRLLAAVPADDVLVHGADAERMRASVLTTTDLTRLFELVGAARTVGDVLDEFHRGRFDTLKGLHTLVESGIVRRATSAEILESGKAASDAGEYGRASRLFRAALRREPGNEEIHVALAEALAAAGEKREAAEELVRIGAQRLAAGAGAGAIESLEGALKFDPSSATAYEGLAHALAECRRADEAADATLTAARLRNTDGDYEGAARAAEAGLTHRPHDPKLLVALANARQALGSSAEALALLDDATNALTEQSGDPAHLAEVLRRILQIDPERRDAAHRLAGIEAAVATRRRKLMRRLAIAAGVVVLVGAAVPLMRGPSAASRLATVRELADAGSAAEARDILIELEGESLGDEERAELDELAKRVDALLHPSSDTELRKELALKIRELYDKAVDAFVNDQVAEGLAKLSLMLDCAETSEARKLAASAPEEFARLRVTATANVHTGLGNALSAAQNDASQLTAVRGRFSDEVWRREDLETLRELIAASQSALGAAAAERWDPVPDLVARLTARTEVPKDGSDRATIEAVAVLAEARRQVASDHDRALSRVRRKELKESYKAAYSTGTQEEREGRFEEAVTHYDAFLAKCDELRKAEPEALYAPIVRELLGGEMQLDQRIRASRDRLSGILREIAESERAEADDDVETSFRVRSRLVHGNPDIDLTRRFRMPLRIETAPPGAEVFLMDGAPGGRPLGVTPLVTSYEVRAAVKYEVRLPGYRVHELVRKGTAEDASGVERIDLPKIATWTSKPGGTSEAAPAAAPGAILAATRSGVVRQFDAATGEEIARFEPKLLAGFATAPLVRGRRVFAVSLDGRGYVLDLAGLTPLATFDTGPVRGAPAQTALGIVVADENGDARLVDDSGRIVWTRAVGRVRSDAAATRDAVVVVTTSGEVVIIDAATGSVKGTRQLRNDAVWGSPLVCGQRIFVASELGELVCLDAGLLEEAWTQKLDGPVRGRPLATDSRLVACTANGAVHEIDAESGAILSKTLVGGRVDAGPCGLGDGGYVVVTVKGNATRFDAKGRLVWRFDAGEDVTAPAIADGGAVILVTRKGAVVSLAQ